MSDIKLKIEAATSDCQGCYLYCGSNGCVADNSQLDACTARFEIGNDTIYVLDKGVDDE